MLIRVAEALDAPALAQIAEATFRATFAGSNSAADMNSHCAEVYGPERQLAEISDLWMVTLLAETGGRLVGFGQLRDNVAPPCVEGQRPKEIYRLYVDGDQHGNGVAQALMAALLKKGIERGGDCIWLGVWEHNPRAISFYQKSGFILVGEHIFKLGSDEQRDLVMQNTLSAALP